MNQVRTRFAPSPTGYLHIGGARTALFCWLFAKHHQGAFVLRVEDTDRERSTPESVQAILDGMDWLGLDYDEGPIFQTDRFERYKTVIQTLLDNGQAYYCYASKEELDALRAEQIANKMKPRYDGRWRDSTEIPPAGVQPVVRFKNPLTGKVTFNDLVRGPITISNTELDDLIIARSDGTPTYNLTVVVDDLDMNISHVIRGDDHINNTPRQINIMKALGETPPLFAHLPMILGDDGARLSKRHGAVSVMNYREEGYFPEAVLNYLVRLGWSHGDQEVFSQQEMIDLFDLADVNRTPSNFNTEKLQWLNQHYLKTANAESVAPELRWHFEQLAVDLDAGPSLESIRQAQAERHKTFASMAADSRYFFEAPEAVDEKAWAKHIVPETADYLKTVHAYLVEAEWVPESIQAAINNACEALGVKMGKVGPAMRLILTGGMSSPSLDVTLHLIGKNTVLNRLNQGIEKLTV